MKEKKKRAKAKPKNDYAETTAFVRDVANDRNVEALKKL